MAVSANSGLGQGGSGRLGETAPTGPGDLSDDRIAELQGQMAKEAIASLQLANEPVKMPDLKDVRHPGPVAEGFYMSDARLAGIQGPVGSGKTTTLILSRLRRAMTMPRSLALPVVRVADGSWVDVSLEEVPDLVAGGAEVSGWTLYDVLFIRETYRQLWSSTILSYLENFPRDLGEWTGGRGDPVTHVINFEAEDGPIRFTARFMAFGDNLIASMKGLQVTDIAVDEMDQVPEELLSVGSGRIDRFPPKEKHFSGYPEALRSYGQIVGAFNAPDEENWTYRVFHNEDERARIGEELSKGLPEGAPPVEIAFFNQPGYGEPGCENLFRLGASYYPGQIAANRLLGRSDLTSQLVYNKVGYIRAGDPVFKDEFSPRIHVSETTIEADPRLPLLIGLDQGLKGAAVIAQCAGFCRWRILGELHYAKENVKAAVFGRRLAELIEARWPGIEVEAGWGDMAGEQGNSLAAEENATWNLYVGRAAGFIVRPQIIGTNRIQPRLEAVRAALEAPLEGREPGLLIDPSCRYLRAGFLARYVWADDVDAHGDKRKVPNKRFTEANVMDALQYLLLSRHRADGQSPYIARMADKRIKDGRMGHNGGPPMRPERAGLSFRHDVLNPYGGSS